MDKLSLISDLIDEETLIIKGQLTSGGLINEYILRRFNKDGETYFSIRFFEPTSESRFFGQLPLSKLRSLNKNILLETYDFVDLCSKIDLRCHIREVFFNSKGVFFHGRIKVDSSLIIECLDPQKLMLEMKALGEKELFSEAFVEWVEEDFSGLIDFIIPYNGDGLFKNVIDHIGRRVVLLFSKVKSNIFEGDLSVISVEEEENEWGANPVLVLPFRDNMIVEKGKVQDGNILFEIGGGLGSKSPFEKYLIELNGFDFLDQSTKLIDLRFNRWGYKYGDEDWFCYRIIIGQEVWFSIAITLSGIVNFSKFHPDHIYSFWKSWDFIDKDKFFEETNASDLWGSYPDEHGKDACVYMDILVPNNISFKNVIEEHLHSTIQRVFKWIENYNNNSSTAEEKVIIKIEKEIRTAIKQYLIFFSEFVISTKNKEVEFEVYSHPLGLELQFPKYQSDEIKLYLMEYINFIRDRNQKLHITTDPNISSDSLELFTIQLKAELRNLETKLEFADYKIRLLEEQLGNTMELLKLSHLKFSKPVYTQTTNSPSISKPDYDVLLSKLLEKSFRISERKSYFSYEDFNNDIFSDYLRENGFYVADQSRSGEAKKGPGELDLTIRDNDGIIFSIIESFRLSSCGPKNKVVSHHIDKLLYDYDKAGNKCNFILVYAEARNFIALWLIWVFSKLNPLVFKAPKSNSISHLL